MKIRVVIADDHTIFREGLCKLLSSEKEIEVCGYASGGKEAAEIIRRERPDVAILDVSMPDRNGLELARELLRENTSTKIILLTMHRDSLTARSAISCGVSAYVLKDNAFDDLLYAIKTVFSGGVFLSPSIAALLVDENIREKGKQIGLSDREKEVLILIASGLSNKEISKKLFISIKTVETHRARIMEKLGAHSTADLVRYAVKSGLV